MNMDRRRGSLLSGNGRDDVVDEFESRLDMG